MTQGQPPGRRQKVSTLTPRQVADELGIAEQTLANWRSAGTGPRFVKVGVLVRYRRSDVEAWLDLETAKSATGRRIVDGAA